MDYKLLWNTVFDVYKNSDYVTEDSLGYYGALTAPVWICKGYNPERKEWSYYHTYPFGDNAKIVSVYLNYDMAESEFYRNGLDRGNTRYRIERVRVNELLNLQSPWVFRIYKDSDVFLNFVKKDAKLELPVYNMDLYSSIKSIIEDYADDLVMDDDDEQDSETESQANRPDNSPTEVIKENTSLLVDWLVGDCSLEVEEAENLLKTKLKSPKIQKVIYEFINTGKYNDFEKFKGKTALEYSKENPSLEPLKIFELMASRGKVNGNI